MEGTGKTRERVTEGEDTRDVTEGGVGGHERRD